jgi:hypothetical protein
MSHHIDARFWLDNDGKHEPAPPTSQEGPA